MQEDFFLESAEKVFLEHLGNPPPPNSLWHYTNSDGLLGILNSNSLRFSESLFMNDGSEIFYGLELFKKIAGEFVSTIPVEHRYAFEQLEDAIISVLNANSAIIFCFCEKENLLNQWRDYGRDIVPYCIGFDSQQLKVSENFNFQTYLIEVIYDASRQENIMLELAKSIYNKALTIPRFGNLSDEESEPFLQNAAIQFVNLILRFKNPAFHSEREWRLITHLPEVANQIKPSFRVSPYGVIPYYEWKKSSSTHPNLPIKHIMIGPSPYGAFSIFALQKFLESTGYGDVESTYSTIPIRK